MESNSHQNNPTNDKVKTTGSAQSEAQQARIQPVSGKASEKTPSEIDVWLAEIKQQDAQDYDILVEWIGKSQFDTFEDIGRTYKNFFQLEDHFDPKEKNTSTLVKLTRKLKDCWNKPQPSGM